MPITIKDLTYTYSPRTPYAKIALDKISFTVNDGDYLGVIGHTGSGKSTLLQHFNGLIKLQSGSIIVDDIDLSKKYDYKKLRARVGMVFQYPEYQLFDETVEKDVGFGPRNLGLSKEETADRVRSAIEQVGLDFEAIRDRSPFELSGGQKRRAALAGVVAMRPSVLVLDEPTAGLDPRGKKDILALISHLKSHGSPTVIMISHNMDEIAEQCSRILVLSNGTLAFDAPPEELFLKAAELTAIGLDVPKVVSIRNKLAEKGYLLEDNIFKRAQLIDAVVAREKAGGKI